MVRRNSRGISAAIGYLRSYSAGLCRRNLLSASFCPCPDKLPERFDFLEHGCGGIRSACSNILTDLGIIHRPVGGDLSLSDDKKAPFQAALLWNTSFLCRACGSVVHHQLAEIHLSKTVQGGFYRIFRIFPLVLHLFIRKRHLFVASYSGNIFSVETETLSGTYGRDFLPAGGGGFHLSGACPGLSAMLCRRNIALCHGIRHKKNGVICSWRFC